MRNIVLTISIPIIVLALGITFSIYRAKIQTQEFCLAAEEMIKNNEITNLNDLAITKGLIFSGNKTTQFLVYKYSTLPGVCIIKIDNGRLINAKYSKST